MPCRHQAAANASCRGETVVQQFLRPTYCPGDRPRAAAGPGEYCDRAVPDSVRQRLCVPRGEPVSRGILCPSRGWQGSSASALSSARLTVLPVSYAPHVCAGTVVATAAAVSYSLYVAAAVDALTAPSTQKSALREHVS